MRYAATEPAATSAQTIRIRNASAICTVRWARRAASRACGGGSSNPFCRTPAPTRGRGRPLGRGPPDPPGGGRPRGLAASAALTLFAEPQRPDAGGIAAAAELLEILAQARGQLHRIERLGHVVDRAGVAAAFDVRHVGTRRHEHDRHVPKLL